MITAWTKHIRDDKEKEQFEKSIRSASWILEHQSTLLKDLDATYERAELSPKAYDSPNWEYRQAHSNGYRQALRDILRLNALDPEKTNDRPL